MEPGVHIGLILGYLSTRLAPDRTMLHHLPKTQPPMTWSIVEYKLDVFDVYSFFLNVETIRISVNNYGSCFWETRFSLKLGVFLILPLPAVYV